MDEFRPPYGRATVRVPRHTVFAGTTNNPEFLRDPTGNRRYWPISLAHRIDLDKVREWRDQLWAEAVVAYRAGENWWLDSSEEDALRDYQENFTRVDCWEGVVAAYLRAHSSVTLDEVLRHLGVSLDRQDPKSESRVKAIIERLGWVRDRPRLADGSRPVRYVRKMPTAANEPMHDAAATNAAAG